MEHKKNKPVTGFEKFVGYVVGTALFSCLSYVLFNNLTYMIVNQLDLNGSLGEALYSLANFMYITKEELLYPIFCISFKLSIVVIVMLFISILLKPKSSTKND